MTSTYIAEDGMPDLHPEGNLRVYQEEVYRNQQEVESLQSALELSDKIASLRDHPGWKDLADRARTLAEQSMSKQRTTELAPYWQGWHQSRLNILDVVLAPQPMTPLEIDKTQQRITLLQNQIAQHQEILR